MNRIIKYLENIYSEQTIGYSMIFIAGALWGTVGLFVKLLTSIGADASLAAFMRLFMGFWILFPIMFYVGGLKMFKIDKTSLKHCLILGVLSHALFNYYYNKCIVSVGVATASILLYTSPIFVSVLSVIIFKEFIGKQKIFALFLNILGCFLMVSGGKLGNLQISFLGVVFGLVAAFFYSLTTIVGKITTGKIHPFTVVFYSLLFGWLTLAMIVRPWKYVVLASSLKFWLYGFGFGLIPTIGSYLFYMIGLNKNLESSRAPVIASVEAVVGTLIGLLLFKEKLGAINILGIILLLLSIGLMNLERKTSSGSKLEI